LGNEKIKKFDEQLDLLKTQMIQMGALCEEAIASATKALINGDIELAKKVITTDEDIDHKEKEIESICLKLLSSISRLPGICGRFLLL